MTRSKSRWWRNLALAIAVVSGLVALILWRVQPHDGGKSWTSVLPVIAGWVSVIAWLCLPIAQGEYRRDLRLRRGEGVRARWIVSQAQWQAFVKNERRAEADPGMPVNLLDMRQRAGADGLEIIVGHGQIVVGNEYRVVRSRPSGASDPLWVDAVPPMLEYRLEEVDPNDERVERALRFPVAAGHEDAACALCRP